MKPFFFKVGVDDEDEVIVGFDSQTSISLQLSHQSGSNSAALSVDAFESEGEKIKNRYSWELADISIGDRIGIEVVHPEKNTLEPTKIDKNQPVPTPDTVKYMNYTTDKLHAAIDKLKDVSLKKQVKSNGGDKLYCSFCGKDKDQVAKLIAGPSVFICDECVLMCADIIIENSEEGT